MIKIKTTPKNSLRSIGLSSQDFIKLCESSVKEDTEWEFEHLFKTLIGEDRWYNQDGNIDKNINFLYSISWQRIQVLLNGILGHKDTPILRFDMENVESSEYDEDIFCEIENQLIKKGYMIYYKYWKPSEDPVRNTKVRELLFLYDKTPNCIKEYKLPVQKWLMENSKKGWYVLGDKFEIQDFESFFLAFNRRFVPENI